MMTAPVVGVTTLCVWSSCSFAKEAAPSTSIQEVSPVPIDQQMALAAEKRSRAMQSAFREALRHWFSFLVVTLTTLFSTAVERFALAGQVQQIMQLPGQMKLEDVVTQLAVVLGIKSLHLFIEAIRLGVTHRLGQSLEKAARRHVAKAGVSSKTASQADNALDRLLEGDEACSREVITGTRLMVSEAAPKIIVEAIFATTGAFGALSASPAVATYFVAHEMLVGQVVGIGAALLSRRRDAKNQEVANCTDVEGNLDKAQIAANDAQAVLDRYVDTAQVLGLSAFVVAASSFISKDMATPESYQRVMMLASHAMQSAAEVANASEKVNRGALFIETIHDFDAKLDLPLFALPDKYNKKLTHE